MKVDLVRAFSGDIKELANLVLKVEPMEEADRAYAYKQMADYLVDKLEKHRNLRENLAKVLLANTMQGNAIAIKAKEIAERMANSYKKDLYKQAKEERDRMLIDSNDDIKAALDKLEKTLANLENKRSELDHLNCQLTKTQNKLSKAEELLKKYDLLGKDYLLAIAKRIEKAVADEVKKEIINQNKI